jgi:(1->4)-alpha-D-glucan 1-alpha-D-glucosylmutase
MSASEEQDRFLRLPTATYRIQLRKDFGFAETAELLGYLSALGVSDLYLSPLFRAREDSSHGYDVVSHAQVAQEFGGRSGFEALAGAVRQHHMGLLLDIVPNHMGINDPRNEWWHDVLRNGPYAKYARFFDIDWDRPAETLNQRVLLPVLGEPYGSALEKGAIRLEHREAEFRIVYATMDYPVTPLSWPLILQIAIDELRGELSQRTTLAEDQAAALAELTSIVNQLNHLASSSSAASENSPRHRGQLPASPDGLALLEDERYREQGIAKQRLQRLVEVSPWIAQSIRRAVALMNGEVEPNGAAEEPTAGGAGWELLEQLLDAQWYRLAYWRVAADEINYRRFFDINDLAAVRVERPEVFAAVHALIAELLAAEQVAGLRIDHVDGLLDPSWYLDELQKLARRAWSESGLERAEEPSRELFVVVEKILSGDEQLPREWQVAGTTGYELLVDVNLLQVNVEGLSRLRETYAAWTSQPAPREVVYQSKLRIIDTAMSSELHMLANQLYRLSQKTRWGRDFTFSGLLRGLREIIACFPVYRTYIRSRGWEAGQEDHGVVMHAVRMAKLRNPTMEWLVFDFLARILLLQIPVGLDDELQESLRAFVLRFQQVTGPITAKGTEDTASYRYYPLASINEVGSELDAEPVSIDEFHRRMQRRGSDWPHALSATATHDTKRGEDLRARLNALSEESDLFLEQFAAWQQLNEHALAKLGQQQVPGTNEQYLLFQTLIGTWSERDADDSRKWSEYEQRISSYMLKAVREAKQHTSWSNPAEAYEEALMKYVRATLALTDERQHFSPVQRVVTAVATTGYLNSLTQTMLKMTVPGVPDFYQGTEYWDFRLVDPDNRGPVDFVSRQASLQELQARGKVDVAGLHDDLWLAWPSPTIKQFLIWRMLQLRQTARGALETASYIPLTTSGTLSDHVLAFARAGSQHVVLVAVSLGLHRVLRGDRFAAYDQTLSAEQTSEPMPRVDWQDTAIELPAEFPTAWVDALRGEDKVAAPSVPGARVAVGDLFGGWSVGCWWAALNK